MQPQRQTESREIIDPQTRPAALRYGVALLATGIAAATDFIFPAFGTQGPMLPFYLTTSLAAWYGGFRAGLLATVTALLAVNYWFVPPRFTWSTDRIGLLRLFISGGVMATISWLIDNRARTARLIQTQREQAQDHLRRHQALLTSAARISGMGSWEYDIANDYLLWDDETLCIFGMKGRTFAGTAAAFLDLVHPDDRGPLREMQNRALESHGITEMEYRIVRPDGEERVVYDRGEVTLNEAGRPVRSTGMVMDITERRRTEEARRASEERWRLIFENSPAGIVLTDPRGIFVLTNRAYQEMVGYTEEELRSLSFMDITYEEDRPVNRELARQVWDGRLKEFRHVKRYRRKDGKLIWARSTVALTSGSATAPQYGLAIVEDITEQRSLEEMLRESQKLEALGRLAGGVAHDFNNMLAVILGAGEQLKEKLPAEHPQQKSVEQINQAARRSTDLVAQLLAFSRRQKLFPKILDLHETLDNLSRLLKAGIGNDVELKIRRGADLRPVWADPGQIGQVLMNLASNARDAMPGGGSLLVETRNIDVDEKYAAAHPPVVPGRYVMLSVSDTGTGIAPEVMNHIFEPFFTTKEQGKGTGLGLATVHGIVHQSGGHICVESQTGRGAEFHIYLPAVDTQDLASQAETLCDMPASGKTEGGPETILLAEDERMLSEVMRTWLEDVGYTVLEARDGREALDLAEKYNRPIDLLLTDVMMPGEINGRDLAIRLAATRPHIKVLYMTGYVADMLLHRGMAGVRDSLLQKPFTIPSMLHRIRETLDGA